MSILHNPLQEIEPRNIDPQAWPYQEKRRTLRVQTITTGPSLTKTDMAEQCDINVIMKNYKKTGLVSHLAPNGARYEDLPPQSDYHEAMTIVTESQQAFDSLPAKLRDRFHNEPARLLAFLSDDANREEAERLNLIKPAPKPIEAPPEPPAPAVKKVAKAT